MAAEVATNEPEADLTPRGRWEDIVPSEHEEHVFCLSVGNTYYNWALLEAPSQGFTPSLFWRSPAASDEDFLDESTTVMLRNFPGKVLEFMFGEDTTNPIKSTGIRHASTRRIPAITIVVVSTNRENLKGVQYMLRDFPHRFIYLKSDDFISVEQGHYSTMGADRGAALWGAIQKYGSPCMVLDTGTAWTYAATDKDGKFVGGGITMGVDLRLRSLHDYCGDLPEIDYKECTALLDKAIKEGKPLEPFNVDTKAQILVATITEISVLSRRLVKEFLRKVKVDTPNNGSKAKLPTVVLTGGATDVTMQLLKENHAKVLLPEEGTTVPKPGVDYNLEEYRRVILYGIADVTKRQYDKVNASMSELDEYRSSLRGLRVAWKFDRPDDDGDHIYRGVILGVRSAATADDDVFTVRYDDGDIDEKDILEIHAALELYSKEGEKAAMALPAHQKKIDQTIESIAVIKDKSSKVANMLNEKSEQQKKKAEQQKAIEAKRATTPLKRAPAPPKQAPVKQTPPTSKRSRKSAAPEDDIAKKYLKMRVAKDFDLVDQNGKPIVETYFGVIDKYINDSDMPLWHVTYDDSDEEDFDEADLKKYLAHYKTKRSEDPNPI